MSDALPCCPCCHSTNTLLRSSVASMICQDCGCRWNDANRRPACLRTDTHRQAPEPVAWRVWRHGAICGHYRSRPTKELLQQFGYDDPPEPLYTHPPAPQEIDEADDIEKRWARAERYENDGNWFSREQRVSFYRGLCYDMIKERRARSVINEERERKEFTEWLDSQTEKPGYLDCWLARARAGRKEK